MRVTATWRALLMAAIAFTALSAAGVGTILGGAVPTANLSPTSGTRDVGNSNRTVHVTGDLIDSFAIMGGPSVAWDSYDDAHELTALNSSGIESDGTFSFDFEVPWKVGGTAGEVVRPGQHTVIVCGAYTALVPDDECVSRQFRIPAPEVSLSRNSGRPGEAFTVSGSGFSPGALNERVWIQFGTEDLGAFNPSSSAFGLQVNVPSVAPGNYKVRVCNSPNSVDALVCATGDNVVADFTVTSQKLTVTPVSGPAGNTIKISGANFFADRSLKLYFFPADEEAVEGDEVLPGKQTNASGSFGPFNFTPTAGPGDYVIAACTVRLSLSCNTEDTATATYSIVAVRTPTPSATPSPTPTPTPSPTPTPTPTPTPSPTPSPTPVLTLSPTFTPLPSEPPSSAPEITPSPAPTEPPTPTSTAEPTATASPEPTPVPTLAPSPSPASAPVYWPQYLPAPTGTPSVTNVEVVTSSFLLALLIAFLVPFPGTLFNKTVEANHTEIQGWVSGLRNRWNRLLDALAVGPLGAVRHGVARLLGGRFGVLIFLGLTALVYGFLSPSFGLDADSLALFVGLLAGLGLITAAFDLPLRFYHGRRSRRHDRGVLRALWWTLGVAVVCVVISRAADFQPGYLYGLVISIVFVTEVSTREEGMGTWLASLWLLVLSVIAWVLLAFVRAQSADPLLQLFIETVLVTFVVAGIETLVIGLLPMRFLPGHPLFRWRRAMWFPLFVLAIFGYLMILVDPANGYLSDNSRTPTIIGIVFLVAFGIVSIGTWAYFRFRRPRPGADRPGEAPAA